MSESSLTPAPCARPIRISTSFARTAFALFSGPQNLSPASPNTELSAGESKSSGYSDPTLRDEFGRRKVWESLRLPNWRSASTKVGFCVYQTRVLRLPNSIKMGMECGTFHIFGEIGFYTIGPKPIVRYSSPKTAPHKLWNVPQLLKNHFN